MDHLFSVVIFHMSEEIVVAGLLASPRPHHRNCFEDGTRFAVL